MQSLILKKFSFLFALLTVLMLVSSCKEEINSGTGEIEKNQKINEWILDNMETYYLWTDKIPSKTDKTLNPEDYFESLLYRREDRFSWIQENFTELLELLSGVQMEAGYDYTLSLIEEGDDRVVGIINYIKPNSPASRTGLKRGDLFLTINGKQLTIDNYATLLNATAAPHTLGIVDRGLNTIKQVSLEVTKYEENPVLLDTVYALGNKKIGYLIYNFFAQDKGDSSLSYSKNLNTIFGKFKATGINELILDLRYNSGGELTACTELSSMIANRTKSDLFAVEQYNALLDAYFKKKEGDNYNKIYFQDNLTGYTAAGKVIESDPINKLTGLSRLYVLTSNHTASASEMVINGLIPYMEVVLVGEVTTGKNVGMNVIYETDPVKQKTNTWGMLPITFRIANAKNASDYSLGFDPDVEVSEYKYYPMLPLGDIDETMLQTALTDMGVYSQAASSLRSTGKTQLSHFHSLGSSIDKTPIRRNLYVKPVKLFK